MISFQRKRRLRATACEARSVELALHSEEESEEVRRSSRRNIGAHLEAACLHLRRRRCFPALSSVLLQKGCLLWGEAKDREAALAWREAVEAATARRNVLQEWKSLPPEFFSPPGALAKLSEVDSRLRALIALHLWGSLANARSEAEQLNGARLAWHLLNGLLQERPSPAASKNLSREGAEWFEARSDGAVTCRRLRFLRRGLESLPGGVLAPGSLSLGGGVAALIRALLYFGVFLAESDGPKEKALAFFAVVDFLASDIAPHAASACHARVLRVLLCIQ